MSIIEFRREEVVDIANVLEAVMSSDPDMPSHVDTMREAEKTLAKLRHILK